MQTTLCVGLPRRLPHVTAEEVRVLIEAVARGRSGAGWTAAQEGTVRVFRSRPDGHEVHLRADESPPRGAASAAAILDRVLKSWSLDESLLALVVIAALVAGTRAHAAAVAATEMAPAVEVRTDELLRCLGIPRRGDRQWVYARYWVWGRLLDLSEASVVGRRRGVYRLPGSKEPLETEHAESLFTLLDAETVWEPAAGCRHPRGAPVRLRLQGGSLMRWIARYPAMGPYLGDLRPLLAAIPRGQASGQWAGAMALAFGQFTREQAMKPRPRTRLTRRALLTPFPPVPTVEEVGGSREPRDVLRYWQKAKHLLGSVGWWEEFPEPPHPTARYGWIEEWLDQAVAPPPGRLLAPDLALLAERPEDEWVRHAGSTPRGGSRWRDR